MKFTILAVVASLTSSVYAGCYTTGITGNQQFMKDRARKACETTDGTYHGYQIKYRCFQQDANVKWEVTFRNRWPNTNVLNIDYCEDLVWAEANGCSRGGENVTGNNLWWYSVDPNEGTC